MIDENEIKRVLQAHDTEFWAMRNRFTNEAQQITDINELVRHKLEAVRNQIDALKNQERVLKFYNGEKVEPVAQSIEAVMIGLGGMSQ